MHAVTALDPLDHMCTAGIVGGIDQIDTRLIDGDRIERGQNADILHARILGNLAAVAVHGEVAHYVQERHFAVKIAHDRACRVRHRLAEGILRRDVIPEFLPIG